MEELTRWREIAETIAFGFFIGLIVSFAVTSAVLKLLKK